MSRKKPLIFAAYAVMMVRSTLPAGSVAQGMGTALPTVGARECQGASVDIELCIVGGVRSGTFVVQDGRDGTVVVSVPSDPTRCRDQTFDVGLDYPATKPDLSVPREKRTAPVLTIRASTSTCAGATPSRVLRLERSEMRYGLGVADLAEGFYKPSVESIGSLGGGRSVAETNVGLSYLRPRFAVDSLTSFEGTAPTEVGKPCRRARRKVTCRAKYAKALADPVPYGRTSCGQCPVATPLALLFTRGDEVRFVADLQSFLGSIDTAADAALLQGASTVVRSGNGSWLVTRTEIDGTCDPFERADVYEHVRTDGAVESVARLLVSRHLVCARRFSLLGRVAERWPWPWLVLTMI